MIILGTLGVANKKLINQFLEAWWNFDSVTYNRYWKKYYGVGQDMAENLKYNDPVTYDYVLEILQGD